MSRIAKAAKAPEPCHTVKLQPECYRKLLILLDHVDRVGWVGIESERTGAHTQSAVIEEALVALLKDVGALP